MKNSIFGRRSRSQQGAAAVELAMFLPVLVLFLTVPLYFARYFMHYTVAEKAARDGARFLSSVSKAEIFPRKTPLGEVDAAKFARTIATIETGELNPGPGGLVVEALCDGAACMGGVLPLSVTVKVTMVYSSDTLFSSLTSDFGQDTDRMIIANVTMPYVGH